MSPGGVKVARSGSVTLGGGDLLPRQAVFRTRDLDQARARMCMVFGEHSIAYLSHERLLDHRHRQAQVGSVAVNSLQYGAGVLIDAPLLRDFYLLQFTLAGECHMWQDQHHSVLPAGSVAIINPGQAFKKAWLPATRQLLLRIDRQLVEREINAWMGGDNTGRIEFDLRPINDTTKVGTLVQYVRMLCDDLRNEASALSRSMVADRVVSGLVSLLLASIPHNRTRAIETMGETTSPFFVRRVEQFIEEHARDPIGLANLTGIASVSMRTLQVGFRRFRNTTPMAYLRAIRLELARTELANAGRQGTSVATVANAVGFGHLGRFARDYQARFGESPSETLRRGSIGRAH
jgi:AraC-like DNA-binding protein